jgi:hypothetical protein
MGHCYSLDLRVRVADFVEAGHSCRAAAEHFDVSESFAIKLVRRTRDTGSPTPDRQGRPPGRGKLMVVLLRKDGEHSYSPGGSPCPTHALRKSFRMRRCGLL